jgi:hypothetical protein
MYATKTKDWAIRTPLKLKIEQRFSVVRIAQSLVFWAVCCGPLFVYFLLFFPYFCHCIWCTVTDYSCGILKLFLICLIVVHTNDSIWINNFTILLTNFQCTTILRLPHIYCGLRVLLVCNDIIIIVRLIWLAFWCLTPLSAIFQL